MSTPILERHRRAAVEAARIAGGMVDTWVKSGVPGDLRARFCETRCTEVERVAQLAADVEFRATVTGLVALQHLRGTHLRGSWFQAYIDDVIEKLASGDAAEDVRDGSADDLLPWANRAVLAEWK